MRQGFTVAAATMAEGARWARALVPSWEMHHAVERFNTLHLAARAAPRSSEQADREGSELKVRAFGTSSDRRPTRLLNGSTPSSATSHLKTVTQQDRAASGQPSRKPGARRPACRQPGGGNIHRT